jgi:imidazoleglycerol phosphate synthase glutamine amidotransferase subunit HisH
MRYQGKDGLEHRQYSKQNQMTAGFSGETRFYFVHSYYVKVENRENWPLFMEMRLNYL